MRLIRIITLLFTISFVLYSCSEDIVNNESTTKTNQFDRVLSKSEKLFFDIDKPIPNVISVRNETDSIVYAINSMMLQLDQQEPFANEFIANIGVPYWNATLVNQTDENYIAFTPVIQDERFIGLLVFANDPTNDEVFMTYSVKSFNESYGGAPGINYLLHPVLNDAYHYFGFLNANLQTIEVRDNPCLWVYEGVNCNSPGCPGRCYCEGVPNNVSHSQCGTGDYDEEENYPGGGGILNTWVTIFNINPHNWSTGSTGNTGGTTTTPNNPNRKNRVRIIQELSNEQFIIDYLLDWLESNGIIMSEDGLNSEYATLLQGNPQITNPIYKYIEGYYTGVVVDEQHAIDLLTLFLDHNFTLDNHEIEHILTFDPDLIDDIDAFLDDFGNDPIAYQIVRDFINLQNAPTTNSDPSVGDIDYENDFEFIYDFYNNMSPSNIDWLAISITFINHNDLEIPLFEFITLYQNSCTSCSNLLFNSEAVDAIVASELNLLESPTNHDDDDDDDDTNDNVYYNRYGHNGLLQYIDGYWLYERSDDWFEVTENSHYIYQNGMWKPFDLPDLPEDAHFILAVADALIQAGHNSLDVIGLIPVAGEIADGVNAAWYYAEGDMVNGALSTASMVPFVGIVSTGAKWSRNTLKLSEQALNSAEGLAYARRFYGSLGLTESALSHVYRHAKNNLSKNFHGVFNIKDDIVGIVDDAYKRALSNTNVISDVVTNGRRVIHVQMDDVVGYLGGKLGDGSNIDRILIVLEEATNKVISAYPKA